MSSGGLKSWVQNKFRQHENSVPTAPNPPYQDPQGLVSIETQGTHPDPGKAPERIDSDPERDEAREKGKEDITEENENIKD